MKRGDFMKLFDHIANHPRSLSSLAYSHRTQLVIKGDDVDD